MGERGDLGLAVFVGFILMIVLGWFPAIGPLIAGFVAGLIAGGVWKWEKRQEKPSKYRFMYKFLLARGARLKPSFKLSLEAIIR